MPTMYHLRERFGSREAFGVGSLLRFLEGQQWSRAMPKRRQAGRTPNASRQRGPRIDEPRASVWSAWSLLPLFGGTAVVAGDMKAPASRTQSKRFAELGDIGQVAPALGVRGACSRLLDGPQ